MPIDHDTDMTSAASMMMKFRDKALAVRDKLIQSNRFQRWASSFPLTRPFANKSARAAFDICAGFVYSQTLRATLELGLIDAVKSSPISRHELVKLSTLPHDRANILIDAAVSLKLLSTRSGNKIGLGLTGAAIAANPGISAMVAHHDMFYRDLTDPVDLLKGQTQPTKLSQFWPYSNANSPKALDADAVTAYSDLMHSSQEMLSADILDAYPFEQHKRVLDIGGGKGAFASALIRRYPAINAHVYDIPAVSDQATQLIKAAGLDGRISASGGDFFTDTLPAGYDAATLVRIAHDHNDTDLITLFSNIKKTLPEGGTLIIAEPMSNTPDTDRVADIYFAFYLLAMGSGRPRSPAQLKSLLTAAGFSSFRLLRTARPMLVSVLTARV